MDVTLITGASGGIGEAITNRIASRNQNLLLVARNAAKLETQCIQLSMKYGISAQFIATDLSKPDAALELLKKAEGKGLQVKMLINNAGIGSGGEFSTIALSSELALIQLNISSLVALTHLFLPQMQVHGGTIVNISSMASFMPVPYMATYSASKAFVRSFTEAIIQECKPYPIHVLLFAPGLTKTKFNASAGIDNETGVGLNSDYESASTQTPEQVADELMKALDEHRNFAISGKKNKLGAKLIALIPNSIITSYIGSTYRKKMKL
ncbi:MAG: SDR family oxidoreductase [Bacteroidota bacterium]